MHPLKSSSLMFGGSKMWPSLMTFFSSSGPETACMEESIIQLEKQYKVGSTGLVNYLLKFLTFFENFRQNFHGCHGDIHRVSNNQVQKCRSLLPLHEKVKHLQQVAFVSHDVLGCKWSKPNKNLKVIVHCLFSSYTAKLKR